MKKRTCILITHEYPYLSAEAFIENEINYISKEFSEIYIFPISVRKTDLVTRPLPLNVSCFPLGGIRSKWRYPYYLIMGLFNRNSELKVREMDLKRILAGVYARGRANVISNEIIQIIKGKKLFVEDVIVYSFWFSHQAVAASLLSEKLILNNNHAVPVARAHGYDLFWDRNVSGFLPFQDYLLKHLFRVFPCSAAGKKFLDEKYPWAKGKVIVSRLGTTDHGIGGYSGEKLFVTCCNLIPLKRISLFAEAFCIVSKQCSDIRWLCIGDGEEMQTIQQIIINAGIDDLVEFKGKISNSEVLALYKEKGIMYFCNVSTAEGLPVSIMEAMSFGIPIIASDVGGTSELVDNEVGFLLSPDIDKVLLAQHLSKALTIDYEQYQLMRRRARIRWEKTASAGVNYTSFCNLLEEL